MRPLAFLALFAAGVSIPGAAASQAMLGQAATPQALADVLTRTVMRGDVFSTSDFEQRSIDAVQARGSLRGSDVIGMAANRNIMGGMPLRPGDAVVPPLVRRGESVTLVARAGRILISSPGRALADAVRGAPVRVVNLVTNRTLDGTVEGSGQVAIALP